ncbi:hypothetical protein KI387_044093 [Taxus chinensis]|uniref:Uncharacterized protein n=1 Tax=Taxus chinensis TaxID=29808 RepID=A0AA38CG20_TAXCH|nr:hypothetical protein KI387_044093 [Taxus chinensis]
MSTSTSQNRKRTALSLLAPPMPLSMIGAPHPSSKLVCYGSPTPLVLLGGLPPISRKYIASEKLDAKYEEVRNELDAKLRDAMFFQLASDGWKKKYLAYGDNLVNLTLNLPNGASLFRKALFTNGGVPPKYVEETLWETITTICGSTVEWCVRIVVDTDKLEAKALRELELK